ncbi:Hypothetical protein D9617_19g103690 [Elsinoe fawcettii]|nr:Hypothetical protein D9617_19g103690 [Elsinoe fawcettii]
MIIVHGRQPPAALTALAYLYPSICTIHFLSFFSYTSYSDEPRLSLSFNLHNHVPSSLLSFPSTFSLSYPFLFAVFSSFSFHLFFPLRFLSAYQGSSPPPPLDSPTAAAGRSARLTNLACISNCAVC